MSDGSFFTVDLRWSAIPRAQVQSDASDQLIALPSTSPYPRNTNSSDSTCSRAAIAQIMRTYPRDVEASTKYLI
jgi:hypothetical protein